VIVSPTASSLAAVDLATGAERWRVDVEALGRYEDQFGRTAPGALQEVAIFDSGHDAVVVAGIRSHWLVAFDLATGAQRWKTKVASRWPSFTACADGTIHLIDWKGCWSCVSAVTGELLDERGVSPADPRSLSNLHAWLAIAREHVYFVSGVTLHALHRKTGALAAVSELVFEPPRRGGENQLSNANHSEPAIVNGRLYVTTMGCRLHIFAAAT
jgi:outer membrane protein assembly factor BamB